MSEKKRIEIDLTLVKHIKITDEENNFYEYKRMQDDPLGWRDLKNGKDYTGKEIDELEKELDFMVNEKFLAQDILDEVDIDGRPVYCKKCIFVLKKN